MPEEQPSATHGRTYTGVELLRLLRQHVPKDFDPDDFLLAGSARLCMGGITDRMSDLDILARPGSETWRRAKELAQEQAVQYGTAPFRAAYYTDDKIAVLYGGQIEVFRTWLLPGSDTNLLLQEAELIDGLKYLSLAQVIAYKRHLEREKDLVDLAAIRAYLQRRSKTGPEVRACGGSARVRSAARGLWSAALIATAFLRLVLRLVAELALPVGGERTHTRRWCAGSRINR